MPSAADLTTVGKVLASPRRTEIYSRLLQAPATTIDLVARLGDRQPRVSAHLAVRRDAGVVTVAPLGRQRVYRIRPGEAEKTLRRLGLAALSAPEIGPRSAGAGREVANDSPVRQARTCYDHLAGVAGVLLLDLMLRRGWLAVGGGGRRPVYELTPVGQEAMRDRRVEPDRSARRGFAIGCADWTEGRFHLGGELGRAVLESLLRSGLVARRRGSRELVVKDGIETWVG